MNQLPLPGMQPSAVRAAHLLRLHQRVIRSVQLNTLIVNILRESGTGTGTGTANMKPKVKSLDSSKFHLFHLSGPSSQCCFGRTPCTCSCCATAQLNLFMARPYDARTPVLPLTQYSHH